jgi:hypothetical protein
LLRTHLGLLLHTHLWMLLLLLHLVWTGANGAGTEPRHARVLWHFSEGLGMPPFRHLAYVATCQIASFPPHLTL